jgi:hypothetical protein
VRQRGAFALGAAVRQGLRVRRERIQPAQNDVRHVARQRGPVLSRWLEHRFD